MKISIITVSLNNADTIGETIDSILRQTYKDIEYIIVDGKSTDETVEIIKNYELQITKYFSNINFHWISEKDKGLYDAMNKGFTMATGNVVGILNADDLFCDNRAIEKIMKIFAENSSLDAVYADLFYVAHDDTEKIVRKWITGTKRPFKNGWHPAHPTFYVRQKIYKRLGLFNLNYRLAADFEIMLRLIEKYGISTHYLNEAIVKMRLGGTTNKNLKNIFMQNIECIRAFDENDVSVNRLFYPFLRILPKLKQYK
ncbi:MAG: glycosyltransferase [Paludibacter sp.]|nr:glycosyltransferase [Paludibacter sp.]